MDDGGFVLCSRHMDRHLLGVRTDGIEGLNGVRTLIIVEILKQPLLAQYRIVRISIRAITAAIDVATNRGTDTHSITAIDLTGNIVAAIHIIHITAADNHTCRIAYREVITLEGLRRLSIDSIHLRTDIGHTAAAIEIVDDNPGVFLDIQEQTLRTGHLTLVTTAVEVTDDAVLQVPYRADGHFSLVVAAKDTGEVEGITGEVALEGRQFHLRHQIC